jgi:hypothetical protein
MQHPRDTPHDIEADLASTGYSPPRDRTTLEEMK